MSFAPGKGPFDPDDRSNVDMEVKTCCKCNKLLKDYWARKIGSLLFYYCGDCVKEEK